jgi:hypothetical protein
LLEGNRAVAHRQRARKAAEIHDNEDPGMNHPSEADLALLAGGDVPFPRSFAMKRHVRHCEQCAAEMEEYCAVRSDTADAMPPGVDWNYLALEMRANIRLGLEAGKCVREPRFALRRDWNPRIAIALAGAVVLIVSGAFFAGEHYKAADRLPATAILRSTAQGVEVRSGLSSLELLNRKASISDQTIGAEGQIGVRYVDESGAVTINNVYLQ